MLGDRGRGTMHRAHDNQKTANKEGHSSLCPTKNIR